MPDLGFLRDLLILFGLGVVAVTLFHRAKLPPIVGFLITGVVCGPYGFQLIHAVHDVEIMAEVGVVLLLFTVGIEFSIQHLLRIRFFLLAGGGLQVGLTMAAIILIAWLGGLNWQTAMFLGMLAALSSTAVVLRLLADHGETESPQGRASLGILIFQDLCVVPMLLVTPLLTGKGGDFSGLTMVLAKAVGLVIVAWVAARFLVPRILQMVVRTRKREIFVLTIMFLCMGTAWASAQAGLSLALGAFIAGLVISESEYGHQALSEVLPFREIFNSLFFISMGMLFDVRTLLASPVQVAIGVVGVLAVKSAITAGVAVMLGKPLRIAVITGLLLAQIGEFSFVLSKAGAGLLGIHLTQVFLAVALVTIAVTPALHAYGPRWAAWLAKRAKGRWAAGREPEDGDASSKHALKDHVIIIGFGVNGRNLARVLERVQIPYLAIEMNPDTVHNERKKGIPIVYGDATREDLLAHAGIGQARVLVIAISDPAATRACTEMALRLNPRIHVIVRTRYLREMEPLFAAGAQEVVPEEFETSVEIFSRVLERYLIPRDIIERCIWQVRQDGYELFRVTQAAYTAHRPVENLQRFLQNLSLEVYRVGANSKLAGRLLSECAIRSGTGATVIAIQRADGTVAMNPDPEEMIQVEDRLMLLGHPEQLASAAAMFREDSGGLQGFTSGVRV